MPDIKGTSYEKELKEVMNRFGVSREKAMKMIAKTYKKAKSEKEGKRSRQDREQDKAIRKEDRIAKYIKKHDVSRETAIRVLKEIKKQEFSDPVTEDYYRGKRDEFYGKKGKSERRERKKALKAELKKSRKGVKKETEGMSLDEKVEYYKKLKRPTKPPKELHRKYKEGIELDKKIKQLMKKGYSREEAMKYIVESRKKQKN